MKGCMPDTNFKGKGWSSKLFTILLILTWELRYPQKRGVSRKRGWEFWKLFNLGKGKSLTLRKEVFAWVTRGRGELYRLTIECTSSKTFVKDFLYTLKVTSTAASSL